MRKRQSGFTLIEMMVVIIILAILIGIAYPAYNSQIRKGRRAEAQAGLQDLALLQEKWRTNDTDYGTLAELGGGPTNAHYNFSVPTNTATTFTVQATATGDQTQDNEGGVSCTTLAINQDGDRTPAACW